MTPADTMRAAVEALVKARGWHNGDGWRESPAAVEKLPWEKLAWESQRDLLDAALSLLRSALEDDALRRAGAAGPLGDPDVLASPLPNEVLQLLNHVEDVVGDEAWGRIDAKLWNAVAKLAAGVRVTVTPSKMGMASRELERQISERAAGVAGAAATLTDAQAEALIEASDGHWKEDVFCIGGPELMALLRAARGVVASDGSQPE